MFHQGSHIAHQRLDQRLVFLAYSGSLFGAHKGQDARKTKQGFGGARCHFPDLAQGEQRILQFVTAPLHLDIGLRAAERGLAGAIHVGANLFQNICKPIHDLLEQMQHDRISRLQQIRVALYARSEGSKGARRCVAHGDKRAIGQHEADGGGTIFA